MASSTDRSEDALPRPELNPLLNPLLADNMGRWAEVYFTSPPEKREEAVLDLLRELQARDSAATTLPEATRATPDAGPELLSPNFRNVATHRPVDLQQCNTCGQFNPPRHQFCGMCGAKLGSPAPEDYRATEGDYHQTGLGNAHSLNHGYAQDHALNREPVIEESVVTTEEPARDLYDLSLFQSLREKEDPADFDYEQPPSVRYRYYIGVILAVLIAGLGYMAWRGGHPNQDAQSTPPLPSAVATDSTPAPPNQNTARSAASNSPNNAEPQAVAPEKKPAEPTVAKPTPTPERTQTMASKNGTAPSQAPGSFAEPASAGQDFDTSGAEDFAMAQRYLSGSNGRGRDGTEAAKWLWKSMGKHYGPAMVALADLYLKGDGVSKNCDQARVLLDSAALRGVAGAGQRLRNLQAFGCQ